MRKHMKILAGTVVLGTAAWFAGCNGTIDKEPNVVLEISNLMIPPITTTQDSTTNTCTYLIAAATGTFNNKPKNALAIASPFNDIILQSVDIAYTWDDGVVTPSRTTGLGGSVPANGTSAATFTVVSNTDLNISPPDGRAGRTAALVLTFHGQTVSGDAVSATAGGSLQVNSCTTQFTGACCAGPGACSLQTRANCGLAGGTYAGDNTSCLTTICN